MHKKYTSAKSSRIYSNDLYFAAYLHSQGQPLEIIRNERRRVTFAFSSGLEVLAMREAYRSGKVMVDMRSFRESLFHIRRLMDGGNEQRSTHYAHTSSSLAALPQR